MKTVKTLRVTPKALVKPAAKPVAPTKTLTKAPPPPIKHIELEAVFDTFMRRLETYGRPLHVWRKMLDTNVPDARGRKVLVMDYAEVKYERLTMAQVQSLMEGLVEVEPLSPQPKGSVYSHSGVWTHSSPEICFSITFKRQRELGHCMFFVRKLRATAAKDEAADDGEEGAKAKTKPVPVQAPAPAPAPAPESKPRVAVHRPTKLKIKVKK